MRKQCSPYNTTVLKDVLSDILKNFLTLREKTSSDQ